MIDWLSYNTEPTFRVIGITKAQALSLADMFDMDGLRKAVADHPTMTFTATVEAEADHPRFNDFVEAFGPIREIATAPFKPDPDQALQPQITEWVRNEPAFQSWVNK